MSAVLSPSWQLCPASSFLRQEKRAITISDSKEYLRATVQLHGRGIGVRDKVLGGRIKTKKQFVAKEGDFLVAEIDAKVGGFGIVPLELDGAIVSSHYFTFLINNEVMLNEFLEALIKVGQITRAV